MKRRDQQLNYDDEQTVTAILKLLLHNLRPSERKMLLSTLLREQDEYSHIDGETPENGNAGVPEHAQYFIQPLALDVEANHVASYANPAHSCSEDHRAPEREAIYEEGYREKVRARYISSFFLPLSASFTPRRWWGYLLVSTLFLFALLFSTVLAYQSGERSGTTMNEFFVSSSPMNCVRPVFFMPEGRFAASLSGRSIVIQHALSSERFNSLITDRRGGPHMMGRSYVQSTQCGFLLVQTTTQP